MLLYPYNQSTREELLKRKGLSPILCPAVCNTLRAYGQYLIRTENLVGRQLRVLSGRVLVSELC